MSIFWAESKAGKLSLGTDYNARRFRDDLAKNSGARYKIERMTPESKEQRGFFEGAVVPLFAYYQENLDHRDTEDLRKCRDWLKIEFNGEFVVVAGKSVKIPKSTKGELNRGFIDRIIDWMAEQGYKTDTLNPDEYKNWRDTIFPHGGPDNYINYLVEIGRLP